MERKTDAWNKTFFDRMIRIDIGRTLKAQYNHQLEGQPMPQGLAALLEKIDELERQKMTR
jgi:hypothetical protein